MSASPPSPNVVSIVDRQRLPAVRCLADSLRRHHRRARLLVLVLDDRHHAVDPSVEPFSLVRPEQLRMDRFEVLAALHDASQLGRIVMPALLRWALDECRGDPVLLLSPHTEVHGPLDRLTELAGAAGLALVPRFSTPIPRDGLLPDDIEALRRGMLDPGCLAVGGQTRVAELLSAWQARLETDETEEHPPVAARWLDLFAQLHPEAARVADPGIAMSVWNLHERRLATSPRGLLVNGVPLRSIDFAGLGPEGYRCELVWPHPGGIADPRERAEVERVRSLDRGRRARRDRGALSWLCSAYAAALDRHGRPADAAAEYGFARLADGTELTSGLRRWIAEADRHGVLSRSPFSAAGTRELLLWLNAPSEAGGRVGVTRFWFEIYRQRPDLQLIHADLEGPGGPGFMTWIREQGPLEYRVASSLVPR